MASKMADTDVCLVCFEARPLKIVGKCKHMFCTKCLTAVLEREKGEVFACPACKVDYPHPGSVHGLVDYTGEDGAATDEGLSLAQASKASGKDIQQGEKDRGVTTKDKVPAIVVDVKCVICHHRKKVAQAENLCVTCGGLHICKDCTEVHAKTKATQGHVIVCLKPEKTAEEALCEIHDSALNSFCHECGKSVCMVCVVLDHGDHRIENLADVIDTKVKSLKATLEERLKRLRKLQGLKNEMITAKIEAPVFDKQDTLIKDIEDHAQECIDQIVKWKEELKDQVKTKYKIIREVSDDLEEVSEAVQNLQGATDRAQALLAKTEHHPMFLTKVTELQQCLNAAGTIGIAISGEEYWNRISELHDYECTFSPEKLPVSLGKLDKAPRKVQKLSKPKQVFNHSMPVNSQDMFIPCVANLGQKFAIAHPIHQGELSKGIDIYNFPGTLKQTLTNIPPFYDMSATPDGNLAVLSEANGGSSCSVTVFDSETGCIRSTCDVEIAKPLSFGVNTKQQYVILNDSEKGMKKQITVVNNNGNKIQRHFFNEVNNPTRITCGGRLIFVLEDKQCDAFEIVANDIQRIAKCFSYYDDPIVLLSHISGTIWGDLFLTGNFTPSLRLVKWAKEKDNEWPHFGSTELCKPLTIAERQSRVSVRGSHIVVSHGRTIKVYQQ